MPWTTPTLREVRIMVRDDITAVISGASFLGNTVLRVMADTMAGLSHLVLRYIDWLARQLLPDTAEVEWLDRHGDIWLHNSDGTKGRKAATYADGNITMTGTFSAQVPLYTPLTGVNGLTYETQEVIMIGATPTLVAVKCLGSGTAGNLEEGEVLTLQAPDQIDGVDSKAVVVLIDGGVDEETDDQLRFRVLERIQNPPMGGDAEDYVAWALQVPGVTRAWSYPQEMGIGTCTLRFMMDDLHPESRGIPPQGEVERVAAYIDTVRPVTVKDMFVVAPIPYYYDIVVKQLTPDTSSVRANIETSIKDMESMKVSPGVTMFRAWIDEAISTATGEISHELEFESVAMSSPGYIPMIRDIIYAT